MRPAGEVRLALHKASIELARPDRAATLRELAAHSQVGLTAARHTIARMCRSGVLQIARTRKVDYRNRPVAEYCPVAVRADDELPPLMQLQCAFGAWAPAAACHA